MHELSLADSMINQLIEYKKEHNIEKIISVTVLIGKYSGVEREPFEFAFPIVAEDTEINGASLIIEEEDVVVKCKTCGEETKLTVHFIKCGNCDSRDVTFIKGRKCIIKSFEIEEN